MIVHSQKSIIRGEMKTKCLGQRGQMNLQMNT